MIGETLEACRQRFFNEESEEQKSHKRFKDYLESQIPFSVRQAYDFMAISQRLALFREKKLGMEQFRALLTIAKSGIDLSNLPPAIESMSVKDLLALKSKPQSSSQPQMVFGNINASIRKLENVVSALYPSEVKNNLNSKQKEQILSLHQKLIELADTIEKNLLDSNSF